MPTDTIFNVAKFCNISNHPATSNSKVKGKLNNDKVDSHHFFK